MEQFEKEIGYFFGVANQEPVVESYLKALACSHQEEMLPHLEEAYREIARQRNSSFDTRQAAMLEMQIILGNGNGAAFEVVQDLMTELYSLVFQSNSPAIAQAAKLRTFLYQYKADLMKREQPISIEDQKLMIVLAKASEELLNRAH